jgi:hypothetical protein
MEIELVLFREYVKVFFKNPSSTEIRLWELWNSWGWWHLAGMKPLPIAHGEEADC